ncbi:MAG: DUF502 domain-containing protein [Candidatus Marinimicrobia bacterium]|nr:DUF502 domain-containing protein [Candidatus Neomarinimicrobiota bacterium]MBL7059914.1 DUF502 domain-containing protein [Candidatus Neomarinimicrobiota bacterium]
MWKHLKKIFFTGLIAIAPVALTFYILKGIFTFLNKQTLPILTRADINVPGLGVILTLVLVYVLGLLVTNILGKKLFIWTEKIITTIPLVNIIYKTIKQITQALSGTTNRNFQSVVYIQYPREGLWTLAFVTGDSVNKNDREYYHLFVPTTPNPTSGVFIMIPKDDTLPANTNIEEALKIVISGGMLAPPTHDVGQSILKKEHKHG